MKNLVMINRKVVDDIEDMVYDCLGYFDEYTYSDSLFIVEFALGMKREHTPEEYMYDILFKTKRRLVCAAQQADILIN